MVRHARHAVHNLEGDPQTGLPAVLPRHALLRADDARAGEGALILQLQGRGHTEAAQGYDRRRTPGHHHVSEPAAQLVPPEETFELAANPEPRRVNLPGPQPEYDLRDGTHAEQIVLHQLPVLEAYPGLQREAFCPGQ